MIRRACLLAGMLAVFLQGSTGGHMLLVEHARCAEHGELVHNGEGHHHEAGGRAGADSPRFESTTDDRPDDAHEHCAFSADRRNVLVVVADSQLCTRAYEAQVGFAIVSAFVPTDSGRFRVAPKNSPPA